MGMKTHGFRRMMCLVLAVLTLLSCVVFSGGITASAVVEHINGSDSLVRTSLDEIKNVLTSISYRDYLAMNDDAVQPDKTVDVDIVGAINKTETTGSYETVNGSVYGAEGDVLLVADDGKISFNFSVEEEGLYNVVIEYYTGNIEVKNDKGEVVSVSKGTAIERMFMIDGSVPFKESRSISLSRTWIDNYPVVDENNRVIKENGQKTYYSSTSETFISGLENNKRPFAQDANGNELKPEKVVEGVWTETRLFDSSGYSADPLKFFLTKGDHYISLNTVREAFAIKSIKFVPVEKTPTYAEYLESYKDVPDYSGEDIYIQAELPTMTSDRTLYQLNDRTSVITQPQDSALIRLNSIGGDKWIYNGQWIEYTITVPKDGMYVIVPRSMQNTTSGKYVSRKLYINGEIPFEEAKFFRFDFSDNWKTDALSTADGECKFFLKEGRNTIRLEVCLGDVSELLSTVEATLNECNSYYRKIMMITGPTPDEYRDYGFDRLMPEVLKGMGQQAEIIYGVGEELTRITGIKGESTATLDKVAMTLETMNKRPDQVASQLSTYKDNLAALGSWLTTMQNQPLSLDYIAIQAPGAEKPQAEAGFWDKFIGEIKKFFVSFVADYTSVTSATEGVTSEEFEEVGIEVWMTESRDHAQIVRNLVDDDFMERYNIPVNVKLVTAGTLLPATLAGTGPDVSLEGGASQAINYAIRSAVLALNSDDGGYDFNNFDKYKDHPIYKNIVDDVDTFDETVKRFAPTAMTPLTLYGKSYGIPVDMNFNMMFYRKDIFVELGLSVPNTWDEFNQSIYTLQSNSMDIAFPAGVDGSTMLMYQQGETMYDQGNYDYYLENYPELFEGGKNTYTDKDGNVIPQTDGITINLDSDVSLSTFNTVCRYFTMYSFPVAYSLPDRFRNGTMPLAIAPYSTYNTFIVFAPEIKGLWEFTPVPGTIQEDGETIDNTVPATVTCIMMMRNVKPENAFSAWTFMQWWTSAPIQSAFANEMEALLGPSAKQPTANIEALESMAWSKDELDNLKAQFNAVTCTPDFPGSYILTRYTSFAFTAVMNENADPVTSLQSYIVDINNELTRKRQEFGLITAEDLEKYDKSRENN